MTGMILDGVLMLLLVAALGYGVRLERKLTALREGQQAFATAVTELDGAAGRAQAALATLRASGQETDLLHDRIIKAREVKAQLETLITRSAEFTRPAAAAVEEQTAPAPSKAAPVAPARENDNDARARRMAALAEHIQALAAPGRTRADVAAILGSMTANQSTKQSLNRARRNIDEDLFAA